MENSPDKPLTIDADRSAIGAMLESERVEQNLSRKQVAEQLNLSESMICALENDEQVSDISPTYVRGYQRAYIRLLGLDESELLTDLPPPVDTVYQPQQELHYFGKHMGLPRRKRNLGRWSKIATVIAVITLFVLSWPKISSMFHFNDDETTGSETVSQTDIQVFQGETAGEPGVTTTTGTVSENKSDSSAPVETNEDQIGGQAEPQAAVSDTITTRVISLANELDQSQQLDNRNAGAGENTSVSRIEADNAGTQDLPETEPPETRTADESGQQTENASVNQQDSPATITFVSNGESWLSIADADNNRLYRNTLKLDRVSVTGMLPLYVSTGNVSVLRLLAEQGEQQKVGIYNDNKTVAKFFVDLDTDGRLVFTPQ